MDLGTLALKMTADPSTFEAGFLRAEQSLKSAGKGFQQFGDKAIAVMDAIKAHPVGAAIAAIVKLKEALEWSFTKMGEVGAAIGDMEAAGRRLAVQQADLSRKFGLSAEAAGGLSLASKQFGLDLGDMTSASVVLNNKIAESAMESSQAASQFRQLGLTYKQLSGMTLDQQLAAIGDALKGVADPAQRAHLQFAILGRRGKELEPILKLGSKGLDDLAAKSMRWGLTMSEGAAQAVKDANIAERQAGMAADSIRQSFGMGLAAAIAPVRSMFADMQLGAVENLEPILGLLRDGIGGAAEYIKEAVEWIRHGFAGWALGIQGSFTALGSALEGLGKAVGLTGDWSDMVAVLGEWIGDQVGEAIWMTVGALTEVVNYSTRVVQEARVWGIVLQTTVVSAIDSILVGTTALLELYGKLPGKLGAPFRTAAEEARKLNEVIKAGADFGLGAKGKLGGGTIKPPAEGKDNLAFLDQITQATQALDRQNATFGMSSTAAEIYKFSIGKTAEELARAKNELDAFRKASELRDVLGRLEAAKSPFEKWADDLGKLNELMQDGALSMEDFDKLAGKAVMDLVKGQSKDYQGPKAVTAGSSEAISAINAQMMQSMKPDIQEQIKAVMEQQKTIQAQQEYNGRRVREMLERGEVFKVAKV